MSLTDNQLMALADLSDGELRYGIGIRGRHSLPSLRKRGLVAQEYGEDSADRWQIRPEGMAAFKKFGSIKHLRLGEALSSSDRGSNALDNPTTD